MTKALSPFTMIAALTRAREAGSPADRAASMGAKLITDVQRSLCPQMRLQMSLENSVDSDAVDLRKRNPFTGVTTRRSIASACP
jgi:hypothetical protein